MKLTSRAIAIVVAFTALSLVLSRAVSGISVPAPYFPFLAYEIWELPIITAYFLFGPRYAVAITLLSGFTLVAIFASYIYFGGILACLSMLLGLYLGNRLVARRVAEGKPLAGKKAVLIYTALAALFRAVNLAAFDIVFLRFPPYSLPEPVILAILPPITVFNLTEPLYVIPIGYFIAKRVGSYLKASSKI